MGNDTTRESLKNDRLRQMYLSATEAAIRQALKDGVNVRAVYADERIELEFTQSNGKKIMIYVRYEDFAEGNQRIFQFVETLGRRNG